MSLLQGDNITAPGIVTIGTLILGVTTTAVDYAVLPNDEVILVTASGKDVTLPSAADHPGKHYTVKLVNAGFGTVVAAGAETIDGATSVFLAGIYAFVTIASDGSNWFIVGVGGSVENGVGYANLY